MWYFIPNPHHKQLKERAPLPTLSGFSSQKVRIHPHSTSHHFLDLNATPKETHVFCCYPRIKWSLNTPTTVISGGWWQDDIWLFSNSLLGQYVFFVFWCNKRNFSDQVHKSVVGSNNWCVPSAMLKFWYSTVELLQTNQNLWHGINGPTQSSTVLK